MVCRGIDLSRWREVQKEKGEKADLEKFVQHVRGNHFIPNTVLVDCTADSNVATHYYDWLRRGIHVITPNKKANSGPLDQVNFCVQDLISCWELLEFEYTVVQNHQFLQLTYYLEYLPFK